MRVADGAAAVVVDHDAIVEEVVLEAAILPALGFAFEVVGEEADEFVNGGGCGGLGGGGAGAGYGEGHCCGCGRDIVFA